MPDTPSITIVKRFPYRGLLEEYSNTYHFSGTTPVDAAAWLTLANALIAAEKLATADNVEFVRAYGYEAGNENSVAQIDYTSPPLSIVTGTITIPTAQKTAGDQAATMRWWTGETSSSGKKVYCRKYFHLITESSSNADAVDTTHKAAYETFGAKLIDGTLPGSFKYCGPQGAVLQAPAMNQWLTTRTLKRRGKRPPTL